MPRYLQAEAVAKLVGAKGEEFPKVIEDLGLNPEQAHVLQRIWVLRIHGRCVRCESQHGLRCSCDSTTGKVADNRLPTTVLEKLPPDTKLMTAPCRKCKKPAPYTVRNALWRLKKKNDWDAFFRCAPCMEKFIGERKAKRKRKRLEKRAGGVVTSTKPLAPREAPPVKVTPPKKRSVGFTNKPFANLEFAKA